VDEGLAIRLRDGHQPTIQDLAWNNMPSLAAGDMVRFTVNPGGLVAVGTVLYDSEARPSLISADKFIRIARVFNA
jgi:translation initiation factor 2 gamma subunit (eIF-2gamma)